MPRENILDVDQGAVAEMTKAIMSEGYTFQDFSQVTDEELEAAYATGYNLMNQRQFAQAERMFKFLAGMNHYEGKYWLAMGAARQMQGNYQGALESYSTAAIHDIENPVPPLRAAECYLALGRKDDAQMGLTAALHWSEGRPQHAAVAKRAQLLLDGLKN